MVQPPMKQIELEVEGVVITATLLDDKAPDAVEAVWGALPLAATLRHARWSGNAAFVPVPELVKPELKVENQVSFVYPGAICLLPDRGELILGYGQSQARTEAGNVWVSHVAALDGDPAEFFALLAETQKKGHKPISIRRLES
jgi:hypothetical protein